MVYLTSAYALYFAACAIRNNEHMLVLEIDTDKLLGFLCPDEDYLAQYYKARNDECDLSLNQLSETFRGMLTAKGIQELWEDSLACLGTCCFQGNIPVSAITRAIAVDIKQNTDLMMAALDPSISLINFALLGDYYKNLTRFCFRDPLLEYSNPVTAMVAKRMPRNLNGIRNVNLS